MRLPFDSEVVRILPDDGGSDYYSPNSAGDTIVSNGLLLGRRAKHVLASVCRRYGGELWVMRWTNRQVWREIGVVFHFVEAVEWQPNPALHVTGVGDLLPD